MKPAPAAANMSHIPAVAATVCSCGVAGARCSTTTGWCCSAPDDDPPLCVVEHVGTDLCITDRWVWIQRHIATHEIVRRDLGQPFTISPGDLAPGMTVTLTAENGRWIWEVTGQRARCCGGYTARWPD